MIQPCEYCGKTQRELHRGRCRACEERERRIRERLRDNRLMRLDSDDVLERGQRLPFDPLPRARACDGCGEALEPEPGGPRFTGWDGRTFRMHDACWRLLLAVSQE